MEGSRQANGQEQYPLKVMKFGGSSVGSTERLKQAVAIVGKAAASHRMVVVASALSMVTRQLDAAVEALQAGTGKEREVLENIRTRHRRQAAELLKDATLPRYEALLEERLEGLRRTFERARQGGATPALRDEVLACGEQLSVPLVALALADAGLDAASADATRLICTDDTHGAANVDFEETARRVREWHAQLPEERVPVVAGFIGATAEGATTTLGFEGSDYSAALLAAILKAKVLERWTDVDGIYTDDPSVNENAERIDCIIMEEAAAQNEAGRLGMHPKTLRPLLEACVPVHVRSVKNPEGPGTRVIPQAQHEALSTPEPRKGFSISTD